MTITKPFILITLLLSGCARSHLKDGSVIPQPNPKPPVSADVGTRVKQMRDLTDQLTKLADALPAKDDHAQRDAMTNAFDLCSRLLPLLMGPAADGQFRLQQRIVADARDQLAKQGNGLAQAPTIDSGLRAIYNALVRISQESFYTSQPITADITELQARVDALDTVRGPLHRDAAASALAQSAEITDRMTRIYSNRLDRHGDPEPAVPNPK